MGVDCNIYLPTNVRLSEVSKVVAVLCGLKPYKTEDGFVRVDGIKKSNTTGLETCANVTLDGIPEPALGVRGGYSEAEFLYHFEPDSGSGRLIIQRSSAFWIAIGIRLVDFFGGSLLYCDHSIQNSDYRVPEKSLEENHPNDGDLYFALQNKILNLKPITMQEFIDADNHAAYKMNLTAPERNPPVSVRAKQVAKDVFDHYKNARGLWLSGLETYFASLPEFQEKIIFRNLS